MYQAYSKISEAVENALVRADFAVKEGARSVKQTLAEEKGSMVEYIIIVAVVASVAIIVMALLGGAIRQKGQDAADLIQNATF